MIIVRLQHGMGSPSIMILLHELVKLMQYAGVLDPIFIRMGTSGSFKVPVGTVVIALEIFNDFLEPYFNAVSTYSNLSHLSITFPDNSRKNTQTALYIG